MSIVDRYELAESVAFLEDRAAEHPTCPRCGGGLTHTAAYFNGWWDSCARCFAPVQKCDSGGFHGLPCLLV